MASVIFVNRFFYPDHSATSQILSDLAFHLAENNLDIKVITSRQLYDDNKKLLEPVEIKDGVLIKRIWTTRFGRNNLLGRMIDYLSFYFSVFFVLLHTVKKGDFIVAKTDPPMIGIVGKFVALIKSALLINWNQDLFPEVGTELGISVLKYTKPLLLLLRNLTLKSAYMNVVIGETMKDKLVSLGVNHSRITTIPNWSDGRAIYPVKREDNQLRKEWGLSEKFVVGYSGNMGRAHEFDTILEIAEKLKDKNDIIFLFIGNGAKKEWIEQEVKTRKLKNFIFKPYQPRQNLVNSLGVPDVHFISLLPNLEGLIVPSKYYGVAAAGKPCLFIGDVNGEIARVLNKNNCGLAIGIGDVDRGAEYLNDMKQLTREYHQQCVNSRELFMKSYDFNVAFESWLNILKK